jgi:hypothetical protein
VYDEVSWRHLFLKYLLHTYTVGYRVSVEGDVW